MGFFGGKGTNFLITQLCNQVIIILILMEYCCPLKITMCFLKRLKYIINRKVDITKIQICFFIFATDN